MNIFLLISEDTETNFYRWLILTFDLKKPRHVNSGNAVIFTQYMQFDKI